MDPGIPAGHVGAFIAQRLWVFTGEEQCRASPPQERTTHSALAGLSLANPLGGQETSLAGPSLGSVKQPQSVPEGHPGYTLVRTFAAAGLWALPHQTQLAFSQKHNRTRRPERIERRRLPNNVVRLEDEQSDN